MSKFLKTLLLAGLTIALTGMSAALCMALPTRHDRFTIEQPDGSIVTVRFTGDEFFKLTTTLDGAAVSLGDDGYLRYVIYENGERKVTDYKINDKNVPQSIISAAHDIPVSQLQEKALEKRRAYNDIKMSRRMNSPMTPMAEGETRLIKAAIILVEFADLKFTEGNLDRFYALCNEEGYSDNGATGSIKDYFKAQFGDMAEFQFDVFGTFTAPKNHSYYGGNDYSGSDAHPDELVAEACKALDDQIDFSQYDLDGDGVCDFVFMFFAGNDEADNTMRYQDCIWSHAWVIDYYDPSLYLDGVRISDYACTSELRTDYYGYGSKFTAIGSFCHEFSHTLGLMDAYDTSYDYDGYPIAEALWGVTSIMDSGCYNNDCNTPPYYNAFEREMLGIATPVETEVGNMTLEPINESNKFLRIGTIKGNEYFVVEYRKKEGWDAYLPTSGLLVYHIDKSNNNAGPSYYYGFNLTAGQRWDYNEVNSYPYHQCADLIEAGNSTTTNNVADVFFPGAKNVTILSSETHDSYKAWNGDEVEYEIHDIKSSGDNATFMLLDKASLELPIITGHEINVIGQEATITWTTDKEDTEAVAHVELSLKDGESISVQEAAEDSITFKDLEPGTGYTATIWYTKMELESAKYSVDFTTFDRTSDFPYIYMNRDGFVKGETVRLILLNLDDESATVEWYIEDQAIENPDNFTVDFDGERLLKAVITYPDGRQECIITSVTPLTTI